MGINIDKNIPFEKTSARISYARIFDQMEPGDSFVVANERERFRARSVFWFYIKRTDRFPPTTKIVTRKLIEETDGDSAKYRIWLLDESQTTDH
jgi:hypothetical protein